ncbi:MAG: MFS transporter [Anaerolineae bacterium]|nr:MFS transporter [Anaerolineae bacterium]
MSGRPSETRPSYKHGEGSSSLSALRQREATRELFRNRSFSLLWAGQLLSQIGDQCLLVAVITLLSRLSSSPIAMLIPAISIALPQIAFGLVGGVMADRWNRKRTMICSDLLRGGIVLAILLVRRSSDLWILYLAAAGLALVGVFFYPARNAAIPTIVAPELLISANSFIQGSYIIAMILGPAVAGVMVELWAPGVIIFDSLTFFISALVIAIIYIPSPPAGAVTATAGHSVWEDLKAGLRFILQSRAMRRVLLIAAIATLGIGAIVLLAIPHLKEQLEASGLEYGIAMSMLGVGSVWGGLMVNRLSRRLSTNTIVGGMLALAGVAIIAFAFAPNYIVVLVSITITGMCVVIARGALDTIAQALSPDEMRGRVLAAVNLIVVTATALAESFSALLGHFIGVQVVFAGAGIVTVLAGLAAAVALRGAARLVSARLAVGITHNM